MTDDEIRKLANLAALSLRDDEIDGVRDALGDIMTLIDELQNAPVADAEPMAHPLGVKLGVKQVLRDDTVNAQDRRETMQKIAPSTDRGLYKVPPVLG